MLDFNFIKIKWLMNILSFSLTKIMHHTWIIRFLKNFIVFIRTKNFCFSIPCDFIRFHRVICNFCIYDLLLQESIVVRIRKILFVGYILSHWLTHFFNLILVNCIFLKLLLTELFSQSIAHLIIIKTITIVFKHIFYFKWAYLICSITSLIENRNLFGIFIIFKIEVLRSILY